MIRYEDLVTNTETVLRRVTRWLGLEMEDDMLRHSELIDGVVTSELETTADQIIRPVHTQALDKWRGNIDQEILENLNENDLKYSAALRQFGYTPYQ